MSLELSTSSAPYQSLEDGARRNNFNTEKSTKRRGALETEDVVNHIVSFGQPSDLKSLSGVNKTFRDSSLKEFILRYELVMGRAESKEQMRARVNAMSTAELLEHASVTSYAQHSILWQHMRSDPMMIPFMPPLKTPCFPCLESPDRPQIPALTRALEEHHNLYIGDPQDLRERVIVLNHNPLGVIRTVENGRKDYKYITSLADSTHKMWSVLIDDQRIVEFLPHGNRSEPQLKLLTENMERHYRHFGGDPAALMQGGRKDAGYFARLASAIKQTPLPEKSCMWMDECRRERDPDSFTCREWTPLCATFCIWGLPVGLLWGGCSVPCILSGAGVAVLGSAVSSVRFCFAAGDKQFRSDHERIQDASDPLPAAPRLLAAPPPPPVRAVNRDEELAAALLQEEVEGNPN